MTRRPTKASQPISPSTSPTPQRVADGGGPSNAGLPYREAVVAARKLFNEHRSPLVPNEEILEQSTSREPPPWPYATPYRVGVGLFRTWETYRLAETEARYGLAVRVQSPARIKTAYYNTLHDQWNLIGANLGMPVSFQRIEPAIAYARPMIGSSVGARPDGHPSNIGTLTVFVSRARVKGVLGLTAAHVIDHATQQAQIDHPIHSPFPDQFDHSVAVACGRLVEIHRLEVDALSAELDEVPLESSMDVALFSVDANLVAGRRPELKLAHFDGKLRPIRAPVTPRDAYKATRPNKLPVLRKVRARTAEADLRLLASDMSLEIIMPDAGCRIASGLVECSRVRGSVAKGDSGTLIVTEKGAAFAMISAGTRVGPRLDSVASQSYYAYPLATIFEKLSLKLA